MGNAEAIPGFVNASYFLDAENRRRPSKNSKVSSKPTRRWTRRILIYPSQNAISCDESSILKAKRSVWPHL